MARGACMVGEGIHGRGMPGRGHAWKQVCMEGGGHAWQETWPVWIQDFLGGESLTNYLTKFWPKIAWKPKKFWVNMSEWQKIELVQNQKLQNPRIHAYFWKGKQCNESVIYLFLPPANEVCKGYVFPGACLSTRGGGVCDRYPPLADTHPGQTLPWADTPSLSRHPARGDTPPGQCMLGYSQQTGCIPLEYILVFYCDHFSSWFSIIRSTTLHPVMSSENLISIGRIDF